MMILRTYLAKNHGNAAVEFALTLGLLTIPMLSVVDIGMYTYDRMQLCNAAQVAAQSVWATCSSSSYWPVTQYCTSWQTGVTNAAQTTSLGTNVAVSAITDGYYCVNSAGTLTPATGTTVGTFASPLTATAPTSCGTGTWETTGAPAEFVKVTVTYTYTPAFRGISAASLLNPSLTEISWIQVK